MDGSVALKRTGEGDGYGVECFRAELADVARDTKPLPKEYLSQAGNNINESFRAYVAPLAQALVRHRVGDVVEFEHAGAEATYRILAIGSALAPRDA